MQLDVGIDLESEAVTPVRHLSRPLDAEEILQITADLRTVMLPEIKPVVREAVSEANISLNDDIKTFVTTLQTYRAKTTSFRLKINSYGRQTKTLKHACQPLNMKVNVWKSMAIAVLCAFLAFQKTGTKILISDASCWQFRCGYWS